MNRLDIPKIIAYLTSQTSVSSLIGTRMYWGFPKSEQVGPFVVLGEVTESQDTVEAVSRLEFRFIGDDDTVKWSELHAIEHAISDLIAQKGGVDFGGFKCYKVTLESNIFQGYDEKTRKTYIRDYLLHYFS